MSDDLLCPFSKPIIGLWCQCPHARLSDRCSGKMICIRAPEYRDSCTTLVDMFKEKSRFVLGLTSHDAELTHAQLMKIRCGGVLGMQRILKLNAAASPAVREVIDTAQSQFGAVANFPFDEIIRDINTFRHRKK